MTLKEVEAKLLHLQERKRAMISPMSHDTSESASTKVLKEQRLEMSKVIRRPISPPRYSYYRSTYQRQNWMYYRNMQAARGRETIRGYGFHKQ
jgi:hypothetical protein